MSDDKKIEKNKISLDTEYNIIVNKSANFGGNVKIDNNLSIGGKFIVDNHLYAKSVETEKILVNEDNILTKNFILKKLYKDLKHNEDSEDQNNKNITILLCEENSDINICGTFLLKFNTDTLDFNKIDVKLSKPQDMLSCCITNCTSKIETYELTKHTYNEKNFYSLSLNFSKDVDIDSFDIWFYGFAFNVSDDFGQILYSDDDSLTKITIESVTYENIIHSGKVFVDKDHRVLDSRDDADIRNVINTLLKNINDRMTQDHNAIYTEINNKSSSLNEKIDNTKRDLINNNITGYEHITASKSVRPVRDMKYITHNNINLELQVGSTPEGTVVDVYSFNTTSVACHNNGGWKTLTPGTRGRYIYFDNMWRQFGMYGAVWNDQ